MLKNAYGFDPIPYVVSPTVGCKSSWYGPKEKEHIKKTLGSENKDSTIIFKDVLRKVHEKRNDEDETV